MDASKVDWRRGMLACVVGCAFVAAGCDDLGGADDAAGTDGMGEDGPMDGADGASDNDGGSGGTAAFEQAQDAVEVQYMDDLASHIGCTTAGLSYEPAKIGDYQCAARDFTTNEDPQKPIVLLVHGNSDTPDSWEAFDPMGACEETRGNEGAPMLAEILSEAGFRVLAIDMRMDKVDDPDSNNETENAANNMDHGWGVPIVMDFVRSAMENWPERRFVVVSFSFGVTATRDALRRLLVNDGFNPFAQLDHAFYLAGPNHGVSSFPLCATNPTRRGKVTCEMGNRAAFSPTYFTKPLNGPDRAFETPCSDGDSAFGESGVCEGNTVKYTTIVMEDKAEGEQQDLFVSEASANLKGADNLLIGLNDFDQTNYFFCGLFRNHYGAPRSEAALKIMKDELGI